MDFSLITKHLTPRSCLDLGCNRGHWTKEARQVWPDAIYLLVEGNPECREDLDASGESFRIALLSDTEKEVQLWQRKGAPACTGVSYRREISPFYEGDNAVPVPMMTVRLDDLVEGHPFDLIKIDTQGSELDILRGAPNTLSSAKAVIMEVSLIEYNTGAPTAVETFEFMRERGFVKAEVLGEIAYCLPPHNIIQHDILFIRA